jgi:hypothetical protein
MDWVTPSRWQAAWNDRAVYSAALIGVEHHAGHLAAADRDRHGQGAVGQLRVVPLAQGEPQHPAGGHVQDRDQVQSAFTGDDLGAVAEPLAVELAGGEVAFDQVRCPPPALARPGRAPALLRPPRGHAQLAHQPGDGVLTDPPPGITQIRGDPG